MAMELIEEEVLAAGISPGRFRWNKRSPMRYSFPAVFAVNYAVY